MTTLRLDVCVRLTVWLCERGLHVRRPALLGLLLVVGGVVPALSGAQRSQETYGEKVTRAVAKNPKVLTLNKVRDNLYVTYGGGGNTTIFITGAGVVLVDTNWAGYGQAILTQVKSVTDKPVTTIINTHTHGDHTGSNTEFPLSINRVAHENTKANMARGDTTQAPMPDFTGEKAQFLPKTTFRDRMSLFSGTDQIDLYYFGRGHTNGDTVLVWPALGVAQVGDLFPAKRLPLIDVPNGGSGVAFPQTLAKAVATVRNVDTLIQGHVPVSTWKDFQEYTDFWTEFFHHVSAAHKAGRTVDEAAAAWKTPDRYAAYDITRFKEDAQKIYDELGKSR
jgi:cyclase